MAKKLVFGTGKPNMAEPDVLPESKRHIAADAPDFPPELVGLHFSGVPAEAFPPGSWPHLRVSNSDEAKVVTDAGKVPYGTAGSVSPRSGETGPAPLPSSNPTNVEKSLAERSEYRMTMDEFEASMAPDPLRQLAEAHTPAGWRPYFSDAKRPVINGMIDGGKVIKDENGQPIRYGECILTARPQEVADAIATRHAERARSQLSEVYSTARANGARSAPGVEDTFLREQGGASRVP